MKMKWLSCTIALTGHFWPCHLPCFCSLLLCLCLCLCFPIEKYYYL